MNARSNRGGKVNAQRALRDICLLVGAYILGTQMRWDYSSHVSIPAKFPTKSEVAFAAAKHFGMSSMSKMLECSTGYNYSSQKVLSQLQHHPYYVGKIMDQYSSDHFQFGTRTECNVPVSRLRVQYLLHQVASKDGGTFQCPEVGEFFEYIARLAPDGTVFCETGFNVGSSASIFLHGSFGRNVQVHSFDWSFPNGTVDFLNDIYSIDNSHRLIAHAGDLRHSIEEFHASGKKCDVWFLDACIGELELELAKKTSKRGRTLFLYHWFFRNENPKEYFLAEIHEKKNFEELGCVKTLCSLSHADLSQSLIRETCFGKLPGAGSPWWSILHE